MLNSHVQERGLHDRGACYLPQVLCHSLDVCNSLSVHNFVWIHAVWHKYRKYNIISNGFVLDLDLSSVMQNTSKYTQWMKAVHILLCIGINLYSIMENCTVLT